MKDWKDRPVEVRNLDNPAFCGVIIYLCVNEYQRKSNKNFPFPLVYLVLPLVLTTPIRANISSRTNLVNWAQRYPELLINFGKRTKDLESSPNLCVNCS